MRAHPDQDKGTIGTELPRCGNREKGQKVFRSLCHDREFRNVRAAVPERGQGFEEHFGGRCFRKEVTGGNDGNSVCLERGNVGRGRFEPRKEFHVREVRDFFFREPKLEPGVVDGIEGEFSALR